jgi:hypothetical protein
MKLYLAAGYNSGMGQSQPAYRRLSPAAKYALDYCQDRLESYHYLGNPATVEHIRREGRKVFLDSGAFSAFSLGVDVRIEDYAQFCKDNADIILMPSVLDAIGDPDGTWVNQKRLEDLGVNCLPCYHFGEPEAVLEYYLDNYEYITIGGMVPISSPNLIRWLDRIWPEHLLDAQGQPRAKVHGFGLTSPNLMRRYPWYSVDSSSWIQISSFGAVFEPAYGALHISDKAPNRKSFDQHFDNLSPVVQEKLTATFEYYGFTVEQLRKCYVHRRAYCALRFTLLAEEIAGGREQHVTEQRYLL